MLLNFKSVIHKWFPAQIEGVLELFIECYHDSESVEPNYVKHVGSIIMLSVVHDVEV